ncbi:MAG: acyltransferase [Betaproteobacteria bacterium]
MTTGQDERALRPHTQEDYFPSFDWLRAACACAVMFYHGHVFSWNQSGNFAVQIFFALSGWLIGGILLKSQPASLPRFFFNRAVRIWVPYYVAAALLLTLSALREPITPKWVEIVTYKMTFVYNLFGVPQLALFHDAMPQKGTLSHFWSVNVEEQFYLVAPLFLVILAKHLGRSPWLWALLAVIGSRYGLGSIMLGVLAATVVHRYGPIHRRVLVRIAMAIALLASLVALKLDVDYAHVAPVSGLLIVLLLAVPGRRTAWGTVAGGMSYPLYLNHWIGIYVANFVLAHVHAGAAGWALNIVLQAAVDIPIAIALYWFIDRKLLAHRSGWYTPRRGTAVTFTAYAIIAVGLAYGFFMAPRYAQARQNAGMRASDSTTNPTPDPLFPARTPSGLPGTASEH